MDGSSGVGGPGQSHCISTLGSSSASNSKQTTAQTRGLRATPEKAPPQKGLHERSIVPKEPTSYLGWLTTPAKEVARAAALFSYDLANTTYQTLTEGWSSIGQGISEVSKFGLGTLGLAASLAQAGLAAAGELADTKGMAIDDSRVDMVGWALAKAGIKTVGVPKSELRQLGMSLARLHVGLQQDIHITQGKLELTSNGDSSGGLKWARSYTPNDHTHRPLHTQPIETSTQKKPDGDNPVVRISNIHLEGIQPATVNTQGVDASGNPMERLTIRADKLAFEVEYSSPDTMRENQSSPVTLSIEINQPELVGESNLLSLVAMSINRYCSEIRHHLPGAITQKSDDTLPKPSLWGQEETGAQLTSQNAHIKVRNIKNLAPDYSDYIPEVTNLSLIDLRAGLHQGLIGGQTSKPHIFFENLEFSGNNAGPFHIRTGQMKLDEDMSGSLDIMVQTPFSKLEEFMQHLPDTARALAKKKITGNEAGNNQLGIMIHLDIIHGDIDLNTLTALGVSEKKLPMLQKQIEKAALRTLRSEHTRFRDLPSGNKEFKLDALAISGKAPEFLKKKLHGAATKKTSSYYDVGDKSYIKTG